MSADSKSVKSAPQAGFRTASGLPLEPCYTEGDLSPAQSGEAVGYPGQPPFTRGIYPTMYRGRLWTMRQYAGFGTAAESNRRYRYLLGKGQRSEERRVGKEWRLRWTQ